MCFLMNDYEKLSLMFNPLLGSMYIDNVCLFVYLLFHMSSDEAWWVYNAAQTILKLPFFLPGTSRILMFHHHHQQHQHYWHHPPIRSPENYLNKLIIYCFALQHVLWNSRRVLIDSRQWQNCISPCSSSIYSMRTQTPATLHARVQVRQVRSSSLVLDDLLMHSFWLFLHIQGPAKDDHDHGSVSPPHPSVDSHSASKSDCFFRERDEFSPDSRIKTTIRHLWDLLFQSAAQDNIDGELKKTWNKLKLSFWLLHSFL